MASNERHFYFNCYIHELFIFMNSCPRQKSFLFPQPQPCTADCCLSRLSSFFHQSHVIIPQLPKLETLDMSVTFTHPTPHFYSLTTFKWLLDACRIKAVLLSSDAQAYRDPDRLGHHNVPVTHSLQVVYLSSITRGSSWSLCLCPVHTLSYVLSPLSAEWLSACS